VSAMSQIVNYILLHADYFVLMLFRVGALIIASPVFGRVIIPARVKIGLAGSLAFLFFVAFPPARAIEYSSLFGFALIAMSELMIGIALAFVTNVFFSLTFISGQLIDMQIGFGIVNVYDQQNNTQIPMVGNLLNIILLLVFFGVNGHQRLIQIIHLTIDKLPVGGVIFSPDIGLVALEVFALSFMLAVMVAMPVVASGLVMEFAFGMLIRTVPQMNMFVIGIPAKIGIGALMLLIVTPFFIQYCSSLFNELFQGVALMFGGMMQ